MTFCTPYASPTAAGPGDNSSGQRTPRSASAKKLDVDTLLNRLDRPFLILDGKFGVGLTTLTLKPSLYGIPR